MPGAAGLPAQEAQSDATATSPTLSNFSNYSWAALVLTLAGDPVTQNNLNNFTAWMLAENGNGTWTGTSGTNNPLNNGLGSGGGDGTGSYPDLATAAYYAAKGIQGGIQGAAPINAALKANAPFSVFHAATINSGWAGGHYSGSGWAGETSPAQAQQVTAASSASAITAKGENGAAVAVGDVTGAIDNNAGFLAGIVNAGNGLNDLTGGAAGDVASAVTGAAKDALSVAGAEGAILDDLTSAAFWKRIGIFAAGGALVISGIAVFIATSKTGQKVQSDATSAANSAGGGAAGGAASGGEATAAEAAVVA